MNFVLQAMLGSPLISAVHDDRLSAVARTPSAPRHGAEERPRTSGASSRSWKYGMLAAVQLAMLPEHNCAEMNNYWACPTGIANGKEPSHMRACAHCSALL